jgi:ligand-binding SRPBCC domain-containing protein
VPALGKWVSKKGETTNMHVEESVVINRPPEEVFDYVANSQNLPEWSSPVQEVRSETQGPLVEEGARFTTVAKFLGRSFETPFEVIVHDPPRRHTDRSRGGPFPQEYTHIIEEVEGGGTRLTEVMEGEPRGFFRLAGPLLEMAGRRQFRADLETLKDLLESQD